MNTLHFFTRAVDHFLDQLREGSKSFKCKVETGGVQFFAKIETGPEAYDPWEPDSTTANEEIHVRLDRPEGYDSQDWKDACSAFRLALKERLYLDFKDTAQSLSVCCSAPPLENSLSDCGSAGTCSECLNGTGFDTEVEAPHTLIVSDFSIEAKWLTGEVLTNVESGIELLRRRA